MEKRKRKCEMNKTKNLIPVYNVTLVYRVRTKAQGKELVKAINKVFKEHVDKWCGKEVK